MKTFKILSLIGVLIAFTTCTNDPEPDPAIDTNKLPTKVWDKTLGGTDSDITTGIIATSDGGFIVLGNSTSDLSGDKTEANRGNTDYWITKINSTGQKVWDKTFGGSGNEYVTEIIATTDGNFMVVGRSDSGISGDKTEASKGGQDYWVLKINSAGQKLWDKAYGGDQIESAASIVATTDGGFIIVGSSTSNISGDKTEKTYGDRDYWLLKINNAGQKIWDKTLGGRDSDDPCTILATLDGNFMVVGSSRSSISYDKSELNIGGPATTDYWVVKINSLGQKIWDKTLGGNQWDLAHSMIATSDGGFLIIGDSSSGISGDKSETSDKYESDYWLIKINGTGQKLWDKTLGGDRADVPYKVVATSDGGFIVSGSSLSGITRDKTEANIGGTTTDYWVMKVNNTGQKVWDKTLGGDNSDSSPNLVATPKGFILAGVSKSGISGNKIEASKGDFDYWVMNLEFK